MKSQLSYCIIPAEMHIECSIIEVYKLEHVIMPLVMWNMISSFAHFIAYIDILRLTSYINK